MRRKLSVIMLRSVLLILATLALVLGEVTFGADPANAPAPNNAPARPFISLRVVGSMLRNPAGDTLGRIEEVLVNTASGQIDYVLVSPGYPATASGNRVTPVPARLLTYAWDQSQVGGLPGVNQVFLADIDRKRLAEAPKVDRTRLFDLGQSDWRQEAASYFNVSPVTYAPPAAADNGAATAPPVIQNFSGSASSSFSSSPVIIGTNGFGGGSPMPAPTNTNAPAPTPPVLSGGSNAFATPVPPNMTRLNPSPATGSPFTTPFPEGAQGFRPPPGQAGPWAIPAPLAPQTPAPPTPPAASSPFAPAFPPAPGGAPPASSAPQTPPILRPPEIPPPTFQLPPSAIAQPPPVTPAPLPVAPRPPPAILPPPKIP